MNLHTNNRHFRGAAAVYAIAGELLLLGYNVAFPTIDKSTGDDLICVCPRSRKMTRIQVRSRHVRLLNSNTKSKSETIKIPESLVTSEGTADAVCIAIRAAELGCWHLGLIGRSVVGDLALKGKGSRIGPKKYASEGSIDFRIRLSLRSGALTGVELSSVDVTNSFEISRCSWIKLLSHGSASEQLIKSNRVESVSPD